MNMVPIQRETIQPVRYALYIRWPSGRFDRVVTCDPSDYTARYQILACNILPKIAVHEGRQ